MPKLLRQLALAWMFVWLPVSGVMASTLPFCGQGLGGLFAKASLAASDPVAHANAEAGVPPCHAAMSERGEMDTSDAATDEPTRSSLPGEHCSLCHLAGAIALTSLPLVPQVIADTPHHAITRSDFQSWLEVPLQPPPLFSPA
jgi:hypothetical protein